MAALESIYVPMGSSGTETYAATLDQELKMLKQPSECTMALVDELDRTTLFNGLVNSPNRVDVIVDAVLTGRVVQAILPTGKRCTAAYVEWFKMNRKSVLWSVAVGEVILTVVAMIYLKRTGKCLPQYTSCNAVATDVLEEFGFDGPSLRTATSYVVGTTVARKMLERAWMYMEDTASQYLTDMSLAISSVGRDTLSDKRARKRISILYTEAVDLRTAVRDLIINGEFELLEERIVELIDVHTKTKGSRIAKKKSTLRRPTYICKLSSTRASIAQALAVVDALTTVATVGTVVDTHSAHATTILETVEDCCIPTINAAKEAATARRIILSILTTCLGARAYGVLCHGTRIPVLPADKEEYTDNQMKSFITELYGDVSLSELTINVTGSQYPSISIEKTARLLAEYIDVPSVVIARMEGRDIIRTLKLCITDRREYIRGILTACIVTAVESAIDHEAIRSGIGMADRLKGDASVQPTSSTDRRRVHFAVPMANRKPSKYRQRKAIRRRRHVSAPVASTSVAIGDLMLEQRVSRITISTPRGTIYPAAEVMGAGYGEYIHSDLMTALVARHTSPAVGTSFLEAYDGIVGCRLKLSTMATYPPYNGKLSLTASLLQVLGTAADESISLGDPLWTVISLKKEVNRCLLAGQSATPLSVALNPNEHEVKNSKYLEEMMYDLCEWADTVECVADVVQRSV